MKYVLYVGALILTAPALTQVPIASNSPAPVSASAAAQTSDNPWVVVPEGVPYRDLADAIKAEAHKGQPSPLNPSCEGLSGERCVKSEK